MAKGERDLVTVATSTHGYEMHILRAYLEDHGVKTFMRDQLSPYTSAIGGVKLDVMYQDISEARELISTYEAELEAQRQRGELSLEPWRDMHQLTEVSGGDDELAAFEAEGEDVCPRCGAEEVEVRERTLFARVAIVAMCGVPLLFMRAPRRCVACQHEWSE